MIEETKAAEHYLGLFFLRNCRFEKLPKILLNLDFKFIYDEGVGGDPLRRRVGGVSYGNDGGGGGPEASALIKPKLELDKPCDRDEEDRKLKLILR